MKKLGLFFAKCTPFHLLLAASLAGWSLARRRR